MKFATLKPSKDLFFPFAGNALDSFFKDSSMTSHEEVSAFKPGVNILETDKSFDIHLALPGIKKDNVKIDLNENNLTISGERNTKGEETNGTWHYTEIREGKFSRTFILPENIVQESIEANFKDGMLEITLPKAEPKQAKAITIK